MIAGGWILLYGKSDFITTVETFSLMKIFWIELDGFFVKQNLILPNQDPC